MTPLRPPPAALLATLVVTAVAASATPAGAQTTELAVEAGASRISPPEGVEGDAGQYLIAGARFTGFSATGSGLSASLLLGRSADEATGGNYGSANLDARLWRRLGGRWLAGVEASGFGFAVEDPFSYRALAVQGGPVLEFRDRRFTGTLRGVVGVGRSETDVLTEESLARGMHRRTDPTIVLVTVDEDLWRYGAEGEFLVGSGRAATGMVASFHHTPAGDYRSVGGRVVSAWGAGVAELRLDWWRTPLGNRTTGGMAFVVPVGAWSLRGFLGRSEPDPLTLTEPGQSTGGLLVSRRIAGGGLRDVGGTPLYRVADGSATAARVTIEVEAPEAATAVEVLGDFTSWEPVAMERSGDRWSVSLDAPPGVHHFGFLVDGAWFVPEDAPDTVPDDWGRLNATMVIER